MSALSCCVCDSGGWSVGFCFCSGVGGVGGVGAGGRGGWSVRLLCGAGGIAS